MSNNHMMEKEEIYSKVLGMKVLIFEKKTGSNRI